MTPRFVTTTSGSASPKSQASASHAADGREQDSSGSGINAARPHGAGPLENAAEGRKRSDVCVRVGKMSITERIGGLLRTDIVQILDTVLQSSIQPNCSSAPIAAWFKPHSTLPMAKLLAGGLVPEEATGKDGEAFSREQEDALYERFFGAVQPLCCVVFPQDIQEHTFQSSPLRPAITYAAAASLPVPDCQKTFQRGKESLVNTTKQAAEAALREADLFGSFDIGVFQAVIVYLTPQIVAEVSRSHSVFIAALIRHFQMAGVDRESQDDMLNHRQIKRHLWQHLLFLNQRAAEAIGPEHCILQDTLEKMPLVQEHDGELFAVVRYECYRIHRWIFQERDAVVQGRIKLELFLNLLNEKVELVQTQYLDLLDISIPLHKYTSVVAKLLLNRCEAMILQTQLHKWQDGISHQGLQQRFLHATMHLLEAAVLLETDPALAPWAWYAGVYQQYHSILPVLFSLYQNPYIPERERMTALVEHVFGPSEEDWVEKQGQFGEILTTIRDTMSSYLSTIGMHVGPSQTSGGDGGLWHENVPSLQTIGQIAWDHSDLAIPPISSYGEDLWWRWPF